MHLLDTFSIFTLMIIHMQNSIMGWEISYIIVLKICYEIVLRLSYV